MTSHMQRESLDTGSGCGARQQHRQNVLVSTKSKDAKPVAGILCVDIHILAEVAIAFDCPLFHTDQSFIGEASFFLCTGCGAVSFEVRAVVCVITKLKDEHKVPQDLCRNIHIHSCSRIVCSIGNIVAA